MQRLVTMLQQAEEYVGTVVDGKLPADPHMGRRVSLRRVASTFFVWRFVHLFTYLFLRLQCREM